MLLRMMDMFNILKWAGIGFRVEVCLIEDCYLSGVSFKLVILVLILYSMLPVQLPDFSLRFSVLWLSVAAARSK